MPRVSVIMTAFNAAGVIGNAVESLTRQTFTDWECIICDDASTDNTWATIQDLTKKHTNCKVLKNEKNLGPASSRNRCVEIARGEYLAIQDADDLWDRQWIETLLADFRDGVAISFSRVCSIDESGDISRTYKPFSFARGRIARLLQLYFSDESKGKANLIYGIYKRALVSQYMLTEPQGIWEAADLFFMYQLANMGEILTNQNVKIYKRLSGKSYSIHPHGFGLPDFRNVVKRFRYAIRYAQLAPQTLISLTMWLLLPAKMINAVIQHIVNRFPVLSN